MNLINIKITFQDQFSFALMTKQVTRSEVTFEKMKASIGTIINRFEDNIHWQWQVISVEQI
jgi:uncharacterized coiled-coil protein SlyX